VERCDDCKEADGVVERADLSIARCLCDAVGSEALNAIDAELEVDENEAPHHGILRVRGEARSALVIERPPEVRILSSLPAYVDSTATIALAASSGSSVDACLHDVSVDARRC
jgi:hypothetical protein